MGKEEQPKSITPAEVIREDETLQEALGIAVAPEFRVGFRVSVFNAEMRRRREALGLTQKQLSQKLRERGVKCGLHTAGWVERFYMFPREELAETIAEELGTTREILFPDWLRFCVMERSTLVLEKPITTESIEALREGPQRLALPAPKRTEPETVVFKEILEDKIEDLLWTLEPIERDVLRLRFWDGLTLEETRDKLKLPYTRERVRQIEAKALRKLRHPIRSRKIRDFLFDQG